MGSPYAATYSVRAPFYCVQFQRVMTELGLDVEMRVINKLFEEWDTTGDKQLDYNELAVILRRG